LIFSGLDARAANIVSTIGMFPGQVASSWAGRGLWEAADALSVKMLVVISLVGGALGALLLLWTPSDFFERLLPWLVLSATAVFAWGSFARRPRASNGLPPSGAALAQFCISVYGGYFGGGIGFMMLAALTMSGMQVRTAAGTKNLLAAVINFSAVLIFVALHGAQVSWDRVAAIALGAVAGGLLGGWALHRVPARPLRVFIILLGLTLTVFMFLDQH
jgi:uncharacterized membrane protein YfcA